MVVRAKRWWRSWSDRDVIGGEMATASRCDAISHTAATFSKTVGSMYFPNLSLAPSLLSSSRRSRARPRWRLELDFSEALGGCT
jgi:hypothetical protein